MPRRTILWLFASLLFVHHHVLADGMALKGLDRSLLLPAEEKEQRAIIQFENYRQTMLLAVNLDMEREEHGLWIVPIPGAASEIQIDLEADFPSFVGQDPRKESAQSLKAFCAFIRAWQIYPILFDVLLPSLGRSGSAIIEQTVEKHGLRAELLSAGSIDELVAHFQSQGISVKSEQLQSLDWYMHGGHCFVATRIQSLAELEKEYPDYANPRTRDRTPALSIQFPSDRPYFPLKATSGYGALEVPAHLVILGTWEPVTDSNIQRGSELDYLYMRKPLQHPLLKTEGERVLYTQFRFSAPAAYFTDELWFEPAKPKGLDYAMRIDGIKLTPAVVIGLVLLGIALFSYLAGGLAGGLLYWNWHRFSLLGLWNLLTIFGLAMVIRSNDGQAAQMIRQSPAGRFRFLLVFTFFYICLTLGAEFLLTLSLT